MKQMQYLEAEGVWLLPAPEGESFEIIISGDRSGPDAGRLAILDKALKDIEKIRASATSYLETFVEKSKFADGGEWFFEGVESGRAAGDAESHFGLYFSIEGDTYGEWSVFFQASGARFYPVSFKRRQI